MHTQQVRPWPAIDLAELRFGIAFGSSVEELADFLRRDVEDPSVFKRRQSTWIGESA